MPQEYKPHSPLVGAVRTVEGIQCNGPTGPKSVKIFRNGSAKYIKSIQCD